MRRDLRWNAPIWLVSSVAFCVWRAVEGDPAGRVAVAFVGMLGLGIALVPVLWLRYRGSRQGRRERAVGVKLLGLALAWLIAAGAIMYGVVSLLEGG